MRDKLIFFHSPYFRHELHQKRMTEATLRFQPMPIVHCVHASFATYKAFIVSMKNHRKLMCTDKNVNR